MSLAWRSAFIAAVGLLLTPTSAQAVVSPSPAGPGVIVVREFDRAGTLLLRQTHPVLGATEAFSVPVAEGGGVYRIDNWTTRTVTVTFSDTTPHGRPVSGRPTSCPSTAVLILPGGFLLAPQEGPGCVKTVHPV